MSHQFRRSLTVSLLGLVGLLCWTACVEAQGWAAKMFNKDKHDFGYVARGADVEYAFTLKNIYKETVHIANVRSSCGCATPRATKTTLNSLEEGQIVVKIDTIQHSHQRNPNITITFDAPYFAEVTIPISVYIRTDVVVQPGAVNFGAVDLGQGASRTVSIRYAGRNEWKIQDVRAGSEFLETALKEVSRSTGTVSYALTVTLKPNAPVGVLRDQIVLVTDDTSTPYVPILVEGRIEPDIIVTPTPVSFGRLTPGQEKTVNVILRSKNPFEVERIECNSDRECFKVRLPSGKKAVQILPLIIDPPNEPGEFTEEFIVTIPGREEPLVFKAFGQIVSTTSTP